MKPVCWKRMSSGKYIDINNLKSEDLDVGDICTSLNNIIRFTGHYKDVPPLTVAEHSILCYILAYEAGESEEIQLACLVHDFAEAYIGDVATPVKKAMGKFWYDFADPIEELVEEKFFGRKFDPEVKSIVKMYDLAALDIERRTIWYSQMGKDKWPTEGMKNKTVSEKEVYFFRAEGNGSDLQELWGKLYESLHSKKPE